MVTYRSDSDGGNSYDNRDSEPMMFQMDMDDAFSSKPRGDSKHRVRGNGKGAPAGTTRRTRPTERGSPEIPEPPLTGRLMFVWPANDIDDDGRYVYPYSADIPQLGRGPRRPAIHTVKATQKVVAACIDWMDPDVGDIIPLIAEYLNRPCAEDEIALLPKLDWVHAVWEVPPACKEMLLSMIPRAQQQHAHNLALENKIDIRFTWSAPQLEKRDGSDFLEKRVINFTELEFDIVHKAQHGQYKGYDNRQPTEKKRLPIKMPIIGFYARVDLSLYDDLITVANAHQEKLQLTTITVPKLMSEDEQRKIVEYDAIRAATYEIVKEEKEEQIRKNKEAEEKHNQDVKHKEFNAYQAIMVTAVRKKEFEAEINMHEEPINLD